MQDEPDYRFSLAAERTHLAYVRTALAFFAGSVVTLGYLHQVARDSLATYTGLGLFSIGLTILLGGYWRYRRVDTAIRAGRPLPRDPLPLVITVLLAAVAVASIASVLVA